MKYLAKFRSTCGTRSVQKQKDHELLCQLPASLMVRTLLYSSRMAASLSFSILSQTRPTCFSENNGMSFLLGDKGLNGPTPEGEQDMCDGPAPRSAGCMSVD